MAFPQSILGLSVQLLINGAWIDVSTDARGTDGTSAISTQRGITSSGGQIADRGTCSLTLDNNTGKYSSRNPTGPYYGFIGRNTQLRVGAAYGAPWLNITHGGTEVASTADASVLDITGDIDLRVDATLPVWGDPTQTNYVNLITKYGAAGQRSWFFGVEGSGQLILFWSVDGTALLNAGSTVPVPFGAGARGSVRVTLDADNGASGRTATFYTSTTPGTAGPWAQLGDPVIQSGTTSIFNSTAPVEVGESAAAGGDHTARSYFGAEVRSGIGGTIVASPSFEAQAVGATSFADTAPSPRTWTVTAGALSNFYTRFSGEVSSWPPQWDTGGKDVTTPISAAGVLQRYGQGKSPLQSTLARRIPSTPGLIAYWPMEDGSAATQAVSPVAGVAPLRVSGFTFAADSTLVGSGPLPQLAPVSTLTAAVPPATGDWHVEFVYNLDTLPASLEQLFQVGLSGSPTALVQVFISVSTIRITATAADGTVFGTSDVTPDGFTSGWGRLQIKAHTSGGGVIFTAQWIIIGTTITGAVATTVTGAAGNVASLSGMWGPDFADLRIGHLAVFPDASQNPFDNSDKAFDGETAGARFVRLGMEQGAPLSVAAHTAETELLGPQPSGTFLDVLTATTQADEGMLHEAREFPGLRYRGRTSLYNQPSVLDLPYVASPQPLMAPLTPVEDDQATRNDSTVQRTNGSSAHAVVTDGPLGTATVDVYDESITLGLHTDDQTAQHAWWRVHLGTWDEARFPQVNIALEKNPALIPAVCRIETGSRIRITGPLPEWLPPDAIDLMVIGYSETLAQFSWRVQLACVPYGPYKVSILEDPVYSRADTAGSHLTAGVTSTATVLPVTTATGPRWVDSLTYPGDFPFDVMLSGERVTCTALTGIVGDGFDRTVTSGWGTASTGETWTTTGGSSSDYSVQGV